LEDIWHLFAHRETGPGQAAMTALSTKLGERAAVLIGAEAPGGNRRSVVALLAGSPQGLDAMIDALGDARLVPNIQGDLAVLAGRDMTSYRSGNTYNLGSLPFWLWPEWWLRDQPVTIIVTMVIAAAMVGFCLYRLLHRKAVRRTAQPRSGVG
jgi:cellulose synthase (UDP-forming)